MTKKQSKKPAAAETSLVLRVCRPDLTSHSGFSWPADVGAEVSAPDWKKNKECGNGLHGWLYGQGDHSCVSYWENDDAKLMVLEVPSAEIVMLGGKCKFPNARVRFIGTKSDAADFIIANEPKALNVAVIGACMKVGDGEAIQVNGARGTATAGYRGTATAGNYGEIRIQWWDSKAQRYRTKIGYVGEDGIKPDTAYRLNDNHELEKVQP